MPVRMVHPLHGILHAVGSEVEWNLKNGWKVEEEAALLQAKPEAEPIPEVEWKEESIEELRVKWQENHGKKPHHKKSIATLRAEL